METEMAAKAKSAAGPAGAAKSRAESLLSSEKLKTLYASMLRCRILDERARQLSSPLAKASRIVFPGAGARRQEAIEVGCTLDLRAGDSVASAGRDFVFRVIRGLPLRAGGAEETESGRIFPCSLRACDPFGVAVKRALEKRLDTQSEVAVAFSHSEADSLRPRNEALALAGAQSLPILFVLPSTSGSARPPAQTDDLDLHRHAQRYGFPGIPVDGNDVVAVYRVAHESLERARRGGGPTLIACRNYPGDNRANRGRANQDRANQDGNDPIRRMEEHLLRKGLFSEEWKNQVVDQFTQLLDSVLPATGATTFD